MQPALGRSKRSPRHERNKLTKGRLMISRTVMLGRAVNKLKSLYPHSSGTFDAVHNIICKILVDGRRDPMLGSYFTSSGLNYLMRRKPNIPRDGITPDVAKELERIAALPADPTRMISHDDFVAQVTSKLDTVVARARARGLDII